MNLGRVLSKLSFLQSMSSSSTRSIWVKITVIPPSSFHHSLEVEEKKIFRGEEEHYFTSLGM
jgi:hypothetical protein